MSVLVLGLLLTTNPTPSPDWTTRDTLTVKATLVEIPGTPPPNDLYDYAYVMKYRVVGGPMDGQTIFVAHFNPRQPRSGVVDKMKKWVKGKLRRFRVGDMHQMVLTPHLREIWKDAIEDHYFNSDRKAVRYWCLEVKKAD